AWVFWPLRRFAFPSFLLRSQATERLRPLIDPIFARLGVNVLGFDFATGGSATIALPGLRSGAVILDAGFARTLTPPELKALIAVEGARLRLGGATTVLAIVPLLLMASNTIIAFG